MTTVRDIEWVEFTPDLAAQYLGRINIQRRLKKVVVDSYAADMSAGRWAEDTNTIVLDVNGDLVNGQHRLTAVVQSGRTIGFWVRRGATIDSIIRMDQGAVRRGGDQLQILGVPQGNQHMTTARLLMLYRVAPGRIWSNMMSVATKSLLVDEVYTNADAYIEANHVAQRWTKIRANKSVTGTLYLLVQQDSNNPDIWEQFSDGVVSGAGLTATDPRLALRNFAIRPDRGNGFGGKQAELFATIRAWNGYVKDEELRLLKLPRREQLPMPKVL